MKTRLFLLAFIGILTVSCISTKSTLKNVDNNAPDLVLGKDNTFIITEFSTDKKYGYDKDYPVNLFYKNTKNDTINQQRFLNALAGPGGEQIKYKKVETCCPFPTKRNEMGAGLLDIYEITWSGQAKPVRLYLNIFEKGFLKVPVGFTLRKKPE
jgi:hypothetical protein